MADFPLRGDGQRFEAAGVSTSTSAGTVVTSGGSANTKGSWTELIASTAYAASGVVVLIDMTANNTYLTDIGIGGSGSEVALIPNIHATRSNAQFGKTAYFPIRVPSGSRLSARTQLPAGSQNIQVAAFLVAEGLVAPSPFQRVTDYGTALSTSRGTTVTASGSTNTKGSYAQLVASTTYPIRLAHLGFTPTTAARFLIDIAVGAGGSETIVLPNYPISSQINGDPGSVTLPLSIPAGTRLAARCQCATGSGNFDLIIYGMD